MKCGAFLLFILLITTACTKANNPSAHVSKDGDVTVDFDSAEEASASAQAFQLGCDMQPCPQNVGSLIGHKSSTQIEICTFSLIGQDRVLTNRHCVPDDLAKDGTSCEGRIEFIFYSDSAADKKEIFQCSQVVHVPTEYVPNTNGEDTHQSRDFAILQMKAATTRTAFKLNTSGVPDQTKLTAISSMPNADLATNLGASLRSQSCTAVMGTMFLSSYTSTLSPLLAIVGCPLVHGDSGTPLIDNAGQVRAVMESSDDANGSASANFTFGPSIQMAFVNGVNQLASSLHFATATNAAVMAGGPPAASAFADPAITVDSNDFQTKTTQWRDDASNRTLEIVWQYQDTAIGPQSSAKLHLEQELVLVPFCFKNYFENAPWMTTAPQKQGNGATWVEDSVTAKKAAIVLSYDSQLREKLSTMSSAETIQYRFSLDEIRQSSDHSGTVDVTRGGSTTPYKINFCQHLE